MGVDLRPVHLSYFHRETMGELLVRVWRRLRRIILMVLAQGLRVAMYGVIAGVIAAFAVTRFLTSLLYGVAANDPLTFGA